MEMLLCSVLIFIPALYDDGRIGMRKALVQIDEDESFKAGDFVSVFYSKVEQTLSFKVNDGKLITPYLRIPNRSYVFAICSFMLKRCVVRINPLFHTTL